MRIAVLDVGGTKIKAGCVSVPEGGGGVAASAAQGEALFQRAELELLAERDTEAARGGADLLERLRGLLAELRPFERIGVSTAGQVDPRGGHIHFANQNIPGYTGTPVAARLRDAFGCPCAVENDVNAAALGELKRGAGRHFADRSFLCLTYGTGIGGAIVRAGELWRGQHGAAGEFGAMLTHAEDWSPEDRFAGSYERLASAGALVRMAAAVDPEVGDGRTFFARLDGNAELERVLERWLRELLIGLANLIHIFNPRHLVLGGGIMQSPLLIPRIRAELEGYVMPSFLPLDVRAAELGNSAGLWGAAYAAYTLGAQQ